MSTGVSHRKDISKTLGQIKEGLPEDRKGAGRGDAGVGFFTPQLDACTEWKNVKRSRQK